MSLNVGELVAQIRIEGEQQATRALGSVKAAMRDAAGEAGTFEKRGEALQSVGKVATGVGVAMTGMAAVSAKAAMTWEGAWTGVEKVLNGTPKQLAELEKGLRGMARELPASHTEIAAVAEAAGRLGVEAGSVQNFTRTMIDMGEATNIGAEDAATVLARLMNVMGTSTDQVSNLGSSVVALGNNFATSESEIVMMSARLAGAGAQVGLTEGDVTGLAAALSAVGIEAEAGGSAMSKVMMDIASSVEQGGERIEQFATTAGMSAEEFTKQWESDPARALASFVQGLDDAAESGGSALSILDEMGISEIRMRDALLRSASASDTFTEALELGNAAFEENTALTDEAARRYETVESQLAMTRNALMDAGIALGDTFLPMIAGAAEGVRDFAGFLADLPDPLQEVASWGGLAVGAVAGIGGVAILAVPKLVEFSNALDVVGINGGKMRRGLGRVARFMTGPWAIGIGAGVLAVEGLKGILDSAASSSEELQGSLKNVESASEIVDTFTQGSELKWFKDVQADFEDLDGTLDKSIDQWQHWWKRLPGIGYGSELGGFHDALRSMGEELATLAEADLPSAQAAFSALADETDGSKKHLWALLANMDDYKSKLGEVAESQGTNLDSMSESEQQQKLLEIAMGDTTDASMEGADAADEQSEALDGMEDSAQAAEEQISTLADTIRGFGSETLDARQAQRDFQAAIDDAAKTIAENEKTLDKNTEAGRENEAALDGIARGALDAAGAILEQTGNQKDASEAIRDGRAALIEELEQFGKTGKEAEKYADKLGLIPEDVVTEAFLQDDGAISDLEALAQKIIATPDKDFDISTDDVPGLLAELASVGYETKHLPNGKVAVNINGEEHVLDSLGKISRATYDQSMTVTTRHNDYYYEFHETPGSGNYATRSANGNLFAGGVAQAFADGGFPAGIYRGRPGGIHKFAEPETGWEAYISGRPSAKDRNKKIASEAVQRLGGVAEFANGGITGENDKLQRLQADAAKAWRKFNRLNDFWKSRGRIDNTDKQYDKRKKAYDKAVDAQEALRAQQDVMKRERGSFRDEFQDWRTSVRRGEPQEQGMNGGGLGLVDDLFRIADDTGGSKGKKLRQIALSSEKAYLRLDKAAEKANDRIERVQDQSADRLSKAQQRSEARLEKAQETSAKRLEKVQQRAANRLEKAEERAAKRLARVTEKWTNRVESAQSKLDSLSQAAQQMASSVTSAVRGFFDLSALGTPTERTRTVTDRSSRTIGSIGVSSAVNREETVTTPVTARSIRKGIAGQAAGIRTFANKLKKLAARGINDAFLAEIASMGVAGGTPVVDALLAGSAGDIRAINGSYLDIGKFSKQAGQTVADENYGAKIDKAAKRLEKIEKQAERQIEAANRWGDRQVASAEKWGKQQVQTARSIGNRQIDRANAWGARQVSTVKEQNSRAIREARDDAKSIRNRLKAETNRITKVINQALKNPLQKLVRQGQVTPPGKYSGKPEYVKIVNGPEIFGTLPEHFTRNPGIVPALATGGRVLGSGTATSDSILARLSNGEHVLTAAEVKAMGGHAQIERLREAALRGIRIPQYSVGGPVVAPASSVPGSIPVSDRPVQSIVDNSTTTVQLVPRIGESAESQARRAIREIEARRRLERSNR